jgi:hypothetical protein
MKAAIIAAVTAAIISAGAGAAAATWISGASIKPHSIPANRLTARAIAQLHGARGARGAFDPNRISYVDSGQVSVPPGATASATANCSGGAKAVGGGFIIAHGVESGVDAHGSAPVGDGSAWRTAVVNSSVATAYIEAYAVCAS